MTSGFFYGTLMHPKILKRVLNNDASHLSICPAILTGYTRHKIKIADYPAILPYERSRKLFERELTPEDKSVRGTLVNGLTNRDVALLDIFEGNAPKFTYFVAQRFWEQEYIRSGVFVHPLSPFTPVPADAETSDAIEGNLIPADLPPLPSANELAHTIPAQTYVWCQDDDDLDKELWSFEEFVRNNAWKWIDEGKKDEEHYGEVDRVQERLRGEIIPDRI
ncbi:hypothetical protein B0F90DRAFT_1808046 [Multifurca ochricompacta]|uniref:Putative gamma-glutamylcyclotransferase n=1 Tax=Multifurca ochricompacta TaxID=376703 RepID=A0AAD4MA82_9AGAM|nr:hypothetical protein B0F90DRAFT_1808046 [Multifurca ochricompacta]